jgi:hypothetical protein
MVAAVALTARESGRAGLRSLLGWVVRLRVAPIWYGVVLLGPLLVHLAAMTVLGGPPPDLAALIGALPFVLVQSVYFLRFVAIPRLQIRYSARLASVITDLCVEA